MPIIKTYRHGGTAGVPPTINENRTTTRRSTVQGWSKRSTRSNQYFLYSIDERKLTGIGWTFTLTIRDCPPTHAEWRHLLRKFFKRLQRKGLIRLHWLTEWQKRGCPHLHGIAWFESPEKAGYLTIDWYKLAYNYGTDSSAQHVVSLYDEVGWFKYLSKHAVRSVNHYQRSPESIPEGWQQTGRMWGYLGDWPRSEEIRIRTDLAGFHAYRRIIRAWRLADAREALRAAQRGFHDPDKLRKAHRRVLSAKAMLKCNDRSKSTVRGVSEWVPIDLQLDILSNLNERGYALESE